MASNAPPPSNSHAPHGLPPVKPPSGRFIVQMFLIPLLIVTGLLFVLLVGGLAWVGTSSPESILARLDNPNPDVRWRAAHELAQVLKRPESLELASDPDFALEIAERLRKALAELEQAEDTAKVELERTLAKIRANPSLQGNSKEIDKRENEASLAAWHKLAPQRNLVLFLTNSLGDFTIPVGVHVLSSIAMKEKSAEVKGLSLRRRRAIWALANLGNNMRQRYYGKDAPADVKVLTAEQKKSVLERLYKAGQGTDDRAKMAEYTYAVLVGEKPHTVDVIMEFCSKSEDVFLRSEVAFALTFWDGPRVEPTLLALAKDDGHGMRIVVNDED